jgi:hypothetical protein
LKNNPIVLSQFAFPRLPELDVCRALVVFIAFTMTFFSLLLFLKFSVGRLFGPLGICLSIFRMSSKDMSPNKSGNAFLYVPYRRICSSGFSLINGGGVVGVRVLPVHSDGGGGRGGGGRGVETGGYPYFNDDTEELFFINNTRGCQKNHVLKNEECVSRYCSTT